MKFITICINWKEHEQKIHDTCSVSVLMPVAKSLNCIIIFMLKKITQCDSLINPERAVCGNGKLELEGKKER